MRLIDADALLKEFERRQEQQINEYCDCFLNDAQNLSTEWYCVEDIVESAPTIEAEPVRHGKWIWKFNRPVERFPGEKCYESGWECSECGAGSTMTIGFRCEKPGYENFLKEMHDERTSYCPNCGAKMDLE